MVSDPLRPNASAPGLKPDPEIKPTDEDVLRVLVEIENATSPPPTADSPITVVGDRPRFFRSSSVFWLPAAVALIVPAILAGNFAQKKIAPSSMRQTDRRGPGQTSTVDSATQAEAEQLLGRIAAGESGAADQVLAQSASWTGKTHRTPKADQFILTALNLPDMHAREAAISAELALDAVPQNEAGLSMLKEAVGNPSQRVWALWMFGALGNRGVDPVHTAKILASYLSDPDVNVRASAVNGLALLATDETVPMMLDRFRNDPSPVVEERAACGLAQSGMYTREQRLTAAAGMAGWLDDSLLSTQQRAWALQALQDISGQNLETGSAVWRNGYESPR